ncbi:MAG: UDP-4-amino-4,6-dideoxy-N-acetyl-beta-L-altrosamine transaminase [Rhodospirillales bacterium]|nr:UDP-4-amino-4,6-dideoxy-N-acetyl-beta-L-altrosamine transaminase [Rhodospirillales bacterium]
MADPFLPYGRHLIEDDDVAAVGRALRSGTLTGGPAVAAFEHALARATGAPHAVACANGTAALHLAALALDLGPGDAAVVPTLTFLATANALRYVGADVVFADVDADTGLLTPAAFESALARAGRRVKAVFPVHLGGQCVDMEGVGAIARARGLKVVEDACHALGGTCAGQPVGACAHSDMAAFSFHPVKTITMGEGGAVTTRDATLARLLAELRSHGMVRDPARFEIREQGFGSDGEPNPWYYEMPEPGFNYRASDIQCALGESQLAKLGRFAAERRRIVDWYAEALAPLAPVVRPLPRVAWSEPSWHLCVVLIDFRAAGTTRGKVMRALAGKGVGSQVHYLPVHRQPYYRRLYGDLALPGADAYYERTLSLPLYVGLTRADVARVVAALAGALGLKS